MTLLSSPLVRAAQLRDCVGITRVHDAAWRHTYRGIIPGLELEKIILQRGQRWWQQAILQGSSLQVLEVDNRIQGYISYGHNRTPNLPYKGEIFELYLTPEFQGIGFGTQLFETARHELTEHGYISLLLWALAENTPAVSFCIHLGGTPIHYEEEIFGPHKCLRIAFGFN